MSYVDKNLLPGEHVVLRATLHWIVYGPAMLWGICGLALFFANRAVGAICLTVALVAAASRYVVVASSEFAVTNRRVIMKTGLIRRKTIELLLPKVESIQVDQPIFGRILGYGAVSVHGTGGMYESFRRIANPLALRRAVQEQSIQLIKQA